jgi:hypothetical protein
MQETKSLNEAMGRKESELLSTLNGETIVITAVEFTDFEAKGETVKQAIITVEGKDTLYRSSGKAVLDILAKIQDVLDSGTPVSAKVSTRKSKASKFSYTTLEAV